MYATALHMKASKRVPYFILGGALTRNEVLRHYEQVNYVSMQPRGTLRPSPNHWKLGYYQPVEDITNNKLGSSYVRSMISTRSRRSQRHSDFLMRLLPRQDADKPPYFLRLRSSKAFICSAVSVAVFTVSIEFRTTACVMADVTWTGCVLIRSYNSRAALCARESSIHRA